jgi:hypothetical protein
MKKLSLSILPIFFIFFISCSKDDDNTDPVLPEADQPYEMADIQWVLNDGDGQEIIEKELPNQLFQNKGDVPMPVTYEPLKDLEGSSRFEYQIPEDVHVNLDSISKIISVPSEISLLSSSEGYRHIGGGVKVPFRKEESYFPFSFKTKDSVNLKPGMQVSYESTLFLKKITATFKARFDQLETRASFELIGKWTGFFYQTMNTEGVHSEIE